MKIYHKINHNRTSIGFHVRLNFNDRELLCNKFANKKITAVKMAQLMNIRRQNVYLYLDIDDISLYRLLQIQAILNFEIVSKKDIDTFMERFYTDTLREVQIWI